jgi:hypothetical protein
MASPLAQFTPLGAEVRDVEQPVGHADDWMIFDVEWLFAWNSTSNRSGVRDTSGVDSHGQRSPTLFDCPQPPNEQRSTTIC